MANRYLAGFDDIDEASLPYEWTLNNPTISVMDRSGNKWLGIYRSLGPWATSASCVFAPAGIQTFFFGFRFNANNGDGQIAMVGDHSETHLNLLLNGDGTLSVRRGSTVLGTTSAAIGLTDDTYIEWGGKIDDTVGTVEIRLNGSTSPVLLLTNQDTRNTGQAYITWFGFMQFNYASGYKYFDDIYVNDDAGSDCNTFMGDCRVDYHMPISDGYYTAMVPSTGSTDYGVVDEVPPSTADYLSSANANEANTFPVETFKNNGADILAIQITAIAQKDGAGTCGLAGMYREGSTDTVGATVYPSTTWNTVVRENLSIPAADAKRAAAGFNAVQYGIKRII